MSEESALTGLLCDECGTGREEDEVRETDFYWSAFGRNCFDFNWQKNKGKMHLCGDCEQENWVLCNACGALIDEELYGTGYPEEYDYNNDYACPECMKKAGYEISVNIFTIVE